jgi:trimethylamine--corrinoid protein Co-methyltransferase
LQHFRDHWYPTLFERGTFDQWSQKGSQTLGERAAQRVEKLLQTHLPEPLPFDIKNKLHEIVAQAVAQP